MRGLSASLAAALAILACAAPAGAGVATTKHNLSVTGPGPVRAATESQICIFCHAPHNSSPRPPLWNRRDPGRNYVPYQSSTALAAPGQPTGASLLCLSCHDGTIALGEVVSRTTPISMAGGVTTMPAGPGRLGTDLSDDHPVSFAYTQALAAERGGLAAPGSLVGPVKLDHTGQLQCTSCHDAHDDAYGKFLVMPTQRSALCVTCHTLTVWSPSTHQESSATWNGTAPDPWPHTPWTTVEENACESCHRPHSAGGRERLLNYAVEEDNCYACHNGNVATRDIQAEFGRLSRHPVADEVGVHNPAEPAVVVSRHVECVDCHNPHATRSTGTDPPGPLREVRGVNASGTEVDRVAFEYEICFRCHADSSGKPAPRTTRQLAQTNVRLEFSTSNPSFHPVVGTGRNPNVPSLIPPWTTGSLMSCTACHNNSEGRLAGGPGPNGPHGSEFAPLLEERYVTSDDTSESSAVYALCYKCHSRDSILSDQSFGEHRRHIVEERTPCNVCHDPHGISRTQGNDLSNSKLINFDTTVVSPNSAGQLRFESTGVFSGACFLLCHEEDHAPETY